MKKTQCRYPAMLMLFKKPMLLLALPALTLFSCRKSAEESSKLPLTGEKAATDVTASAIYANQTINWENRTNMTTYTAAQAAEDFGNVSGWVDSRGYISNGNGGGKSARVTLLPNALSGAGGIVANVDISDGSAYEMDYDVKFHSQFNWGRGGKVGFGFTVGDGNTGGDPGWDGNGGSLRLMWYSPNTNPARVYFQPYLYHKDQAGNYGDSYGKSFPSSGALVKGQWYHVHLYIKSNTGSNTDGHVQIVIDGTIVLDRDMRWTTNDAKRLIRNMTFHTFRGGSSLADWGVSTQDYVYYDNLVLHKIS